MAEDSDLEKTEQATPRRIEQAREKGQVARSRELSTFLVLMAAGGVFLMLGGRLMDSLLTAVKAGLSFDRETVFNPALMQVILHKEAYFILQAFLPFLGAMLVVAFFSPILLSGWLFTAKSLQPDFAKLDPFKGIARIFSVTGLIEMVKAIAKSLLIGGMAVWVMLLHKSAILGLATEPFRPAMAHVGSLVISTFLAVSASLLVLVAIDVPFQLWDYAKKLRMSKDEVKQESKESEGDPQIKARIRSLQREMARKRMMSEVPKADVIVTNPTHYAVALKYEDKAMRAPTVIAKGSHLLAQRIQEIAATHQVPVLRTPPLARALYRHAELGDEIPAALYTAVAEVLAYIYQLRRYHRQGGEEPYLSADLPVPTDMASGGDE
ncbi:MAG TPA: flagellar biosynthetic protein FlhB [Betaproteobacteria bacterium]|nr:flagellar biosynthetic protein FlhB [Betaproteobacteria bacterium]